MRIARFSVADAAGPGSPAGPYFGVVDGDPADSSSLTVTPIDGHPFGPFERLHTALPLADVRLLAPVLPSKVLAYGRNYADHAAELGNEVAEAPLLFLKPSTSVIGPGDPVQLPSASERVEHEAELAVVIGRLCRDVPRDRVPEVVLGYTCANDVTARDIQRAEVQFTRAKGFDTFCPLGPWVETELDATDVRVTASVDGDLRQDGRTSRMIHDVAALVVHASAAMTLLPGDVLLTGTPAGVGPLVAGDRVTVTVEGVGSLTNPVVARG